jgi:hypothetical protein
VEFNTKDFGAEPLKKLVSNFLAAKSASFGVDKQVWLLNGFILGTVEISRLNFGILSLLPKCLGLNPSNNTDQLPD